MRFTPLLLFFGLAASAGFVVTIVQGLSSRPIVPDAIAAPQSGEVRVVHAEGRVVARAGKRVTLSAEVGARIVAIPVVEGQRVKAGDLLAQLDDTEARAMLHEALGSAGEAWARLRARRDDVRRSKALVDSGALPKTENDRVREEKGAAEGRLHASNGAASRARALLAKTRIVAPIDGVVISRLAEPSETVAPGMPLLVVADLDDRRIEAEVDEYDIGRVALGASATISADGFPNQSWNGSVEEIPDAVGPRRLRPQDPSRPTDSSVLAVKVGIAAGSPLKLGQRVTVTFPLGR